MALRLHVAAHHAKAHHRLAVFGEEAGNDRLERPLARRHAIGVVRVEREAIAAVLQRHAPLRDHDARAEAHVVALDEGDHHAGGIGGSEIDRAAAHRVARLEILCLGAIDQFGAASQIGGVEHVLRRNIHCDRIGGVAIGVGETEFHRLDLQMLGLRAVRRETGQIEVIENAERDQRRDALAVRRQFVGGVAAIILRDGIDPFRLVGGEIGRRHHAAFVARMTLDRFRDLAAIQRRAACLGDLSQRFGGGGKSEALTDFRRPALGQKGFLEAGLLD